MNHIIALPYYSEKETNNFYQILSRWTLFCETSIDYSFLIVRRFDIAENSTILKECEKYAPTQSIVCSNYQWTGWPAGANGMFKHALEHINNNETKDGGFVFWFEHDVIPININWLNWLDKLWSTEFSVMGQYMSPPWINLHQVPMIPNVNGTAAYNKELANNKAFDKIIPNKPFDFTLSEELSQHEGKVCALPLLYDLWFFMPDWVDRCDMTKLMINGIKSFDQREQIIQYILRHRKD
jgi:hypothetical protein